jgi:hypothetical protein
MCSKRDDAWQPTVTLAAVPLARAPSPLIFALTSRPALLGISAQMRDVGVPASE